MRLTRKSEGTPFERWGGQPFFDALVEQFYTGVATDPRLRPMYPDDLEESKSHLALFLGQYWGGPDTYNQVRGHPRLRMRHAPFTIGPLEAESWMRHMTHAVDAMGMDPDDRAELLDYLGMAARSLQNTH
ncbi:MAG TPA: globin [Acidimicrobiales bacterium]|nr:globin [Acidimicrobiales bacterium]